MTISLRRALLLPLILLALAAGAARAQSPSQLPLQIEVEFTSNISRTCGPIRLQLLLTWGGPGVFHGALELEARDSSNELIATYLLDNLYLTEGQQSQELMLPGYRLGMVDDAFTLRPRVIARQSDREWRLDDLQIQVPDDQQRELVVAILGSEASFLSRRDNDLTDALRLERLAPPSPLKPGILTKSTDWQAENAPQDPLRYCACDIVLLTAEGLSLLQPPQLEALRVWVRAGGGICVMLGDASVEAPQVAFLNSLAGATDDRPMFLRDSGGRMVHELDEAAGTSLKRMLGLGRVVMVAGPDQSHPAAPHWPQSAAFLWRLRHEHLESIAEQGTWSAERTLQTARDDLERSQANYGSVDEVLERQAANFQAQPAYGLTDLVMGLLPTGVRLVPLGTMCAWLAVYLVMVGPVDYFVLGWLNKRKWTWATFPITTLIFTAISIAVSNSSMSASTMRRSAVIHDVTAGGVVARQNRLELLFPSKTQQVVTETGRGLMMPLRYQDFAQFGSGYMFANPAAFEARQGMRTQPAYFSGRMPSQCAMLQGVPQWTPQLNRVLNIPIEPPQDLPPFDWDEVPDFKSPAGLDQLRARIEAAFDVSLPDRLRLGPSTGVSAGVLHARTSTTLVGEAQLFQFQSHEQMLVNTPYGRQWRTQSDSYLRLLSVGVQSGFLGVCSGYAPTGGDRFEDLCVLDPTDDRQWLLIIVQPQGVDYQIYRRLYVLED